MLVGSQSAAVHTAVGHTWVAAVVGHTRAAGHTQAAVQIAAAAGHTQAACAWVAVAAARHAAALRPPGYCWHVCGPSVP